MSEEKKTQWIYLFFFGIIIFITIFFPLFGGSLRSDFGLVLSKLYYVIGTILVFVGILLILGGILSLVCKRPLIGIFSMIMGAIVLAFAGYFLYPGTTGSGASGTDAPSGYH
ncbi:MAG: hypothetical protein ACFFAO_09445 [Candidatus Hermodarchaeota archaeon]